MALQYDDIESSRLQM